LPGSKIQGPVPPETMAGGAFHLPYSGQADGPTFSSFKSMPYA
jgi:hypothetical protein